MNEITEVQQLMDPPPGLRAGTVYAARSRLLQAASVPARKRRPWVLPLVAGTSAAAAAVGAFAAVGRGPQPEVAALAAWTVQRSASDAVTVTVREFRDPAGLQRSLSAAGVPAVVQFSASPCPFPYQAIPGNAAIIGRVLEREVRGPSGVVFTIHPSAIPTGTILDLMFPLAGGDKKPMPAPTGLQSALPSPAPLRGAAVPHPVAIRLIPSASSRHRIRPAASLLVMKLGAVVGTQDDPVAFARHVRRLEEAGVEYLWAGEAYTADAVSTLGFVAAVTSRAQLGSAILPLYTRTPSLLAMTAVGLDRLSGGRFILGIGASGPQVIEGFHGLPYEAPVGRTREIIEICHSVWRRDRVVHSGAHYEIPLGEGRGTGLGKPLKLIDHPIRDRIPIYVASLGPKNVEMTAALAEGWLPLYYWPDRAARVWGASLAAGRARRADDMPPLEVVAGGPLAIGDNVEHLRELARPTLALYFGGMGARGQNFYNDVLKRYGYEPEAERIQDAYLAGDKEAAAALVPAELVTGMSLIGDEGFVRDRIAAYRESGVTVLNVQPVGPNGTADIETVAGWL